MNRLSFLGLNSNEAACVLLYLIAVIWVLNFSSRRFYAKIILMVIEAAFVIALATTMSRGGVVALICALRCSKSLNLAAAHRDGAPCLKQTWQSALHWFSYSPVWRVLLLLTSPGLWLRSTPGFIAQDASIGNRFELWKGAVKLIVTAPLRGWGYYNTGASYMNWLQGVNDHAYYNGLVNSYLQIGAAFGLPVLCGVLFVLILALLLAHSLVLGRAVSPKPPRTARRAIHTFIGLLCFLWILIWMLMSCFSSMFASPLLIIPPLAAVLVALLLHPPRRSEIIGSLMISFSLCLLLFSLGRRFAWNDSISIKLDESGIITVTNNEIKTGRTCVIYVDQEALGEEFGKEVRKFLIGSNFGACVVVEKAGNFSVSEIKASHAELIILSGITVAHVEIREGTAKYVLLNPAFLPGYMPSGAIQAIVYPEVNRRRYFDPETSVLDKFQSKIHMVPFNENFEISWSE